MKLDPKIIQQWRDDDCNQPKQPGGFLTDYIAQRAADYALEQAWWAI